MTLAEKRELYLAFFTSTGGEEFIKELDRMIEDDHREAERNPHLARDYSQSAKGTRRVLEHIRTITTEVKKGGVAKH